MRNLIDQLRARHFVVLSLATLLLVGGVGAALGAPSDETAIRRPEADADDAGLLVDDPDDDTNDGVRNLIAVDGTDNDGVDTTGNAQAAPAAQTNNDGTDNDGVDTTGNAQAAQAAQTDNDGTDSDGVATGAVMATDNDGTDSDGIATGAAAPAPAPAPAGGADTGADTGVGGDT
jgi:hypothetical protein